MALQPAPLNTTFMISAMLGFFISVVYIRNLSLTWAFAFSILFMVMIIASLISMLRAPARGQLMPSLERESSESKEALEELKIASAKTHKKKK